MDALILKGGEVYDPLTKERKKRDLGVRDGILVPPESIPHNQAYTVNGEGCLVVPGLIDYHVHLYTGCDGGVPADLLCPPSGVTTAVDGGTCGVSTFGTFKWKDADPSVTRVLGFLHVASSGLASAVMPENMNPDYFEKEKILELFRQYPGILKGLKFRISRNIVGPTGLTREPLIKALEIAQEAGCPLVVHVNDPVIPMEELAEMLRPGDVFCHMYQGHGDTILDTSGYIKPGILRARKRGVLFDASNGRGNFDFNVACPAMDQGFWPDIISSDISPISLFRQPAVSLPWLMAKYLAFGMDLWQVLDRVTLHPARQLGLEELGTLAEGTVADLTVLRIQEQKVRFYDWKGQSISGSQVIVPQMTVKGGRIVYCQAGIGGVLTIRETTL